MKLNQQLVALRELIGQGELEQALPQLVALLEAGGESYAEFAQTARVNQAEYFQLKAQQLRGTVAEEDARLTTNRVTDNTLQLIRDLAAGREHPGAKATPARSRAWRYYLTGGLVALTGALLTWYFWDREACPDFGKDPGLRVMILPFKQTGREKGAEPEFQIMNGLNKLIEQTPGMKAVADVHQHYDIEKNYPNPAEAPDIARGCGVEMLVWGLLNQSADREYSLDVRYKLLDAGGVRYSGDTTINRLLTVTDEGRWVQDVESVTRLLYFVLANQLRTPIASNLLAELQPSAKSLTEDLPPPDTTTSLILADYYLRMGQPEKALAEYDRVLEAYPELASARLGRGVVRYSVKDYPGAARDLEAAAPKSKTTLPVYRELRVDAFLKSGQPEKAEQELQQARREGTKDNAWVEQKAREARDSTVAVTRRAEKMEKLAQQNPQNKAARISAAKARNGLGDPDKALQIVDQVLQQDPKNVVAVQTAVESHLLKGDTAAAKKVFDRAVEAGANIKAIEWQAPVRPDATRKKTQ